MPLIGLRPNKSERDLRRRSTLDPNTSLGRKEQDTLAEEDKRRSTMGRGARSHDGGRPTLSVEPTGGDDVPVQDQTRNHRRFSMMRFRHASDTQLSLRAREQAAAAAGIGTPDPEAPPMPVVPDAPRIITTAPTMETPPAVEKKKPLFPSLTRHKASSATELPEPHPAPPRKSLEKKRKDRNKDEKESRFGSLRPSRLLSAENRRHSMLPPPVPAVDGAAASPNQTSSNLALPSVSRPSDSSRSDGSSGGSGERVTFAATPPRETTKRTTSFFKMPSRNKNRQSLFPLPVRIPPSESQISAPATPRASTNTNRSLGGNGSPSAASPPYATPLFQSRSSIAGDEGNSTLTPSAGTALAASTVSFAAPGTTLFRNDSTRSNRSVTSSPSHSLAPPVRFGLRGRSSTLGSVRSSDDVTPPTPPQPLSGRTSTSTAGRNSFAGLLGISSRFRNNSEPHSPRRNSPGNGLPTPVGSKSNSFNISREALLVPERQEGDTPLKYLERLEAAISRDLIATVLSKANDPFLHNVLRAYMRKFALFGDPIDIAIRKFLMEAQLPPETQQIDRVLQSFADRYHECNPGIYTNPDQAYLVAFSLIMLHTDLFNRNVKQKMQKTDYVRNLSTEGIAEDILSCLYDNIAYTPFIHVDEEDEHGVRFLASRKKGSFRTAVSEPVRKVTKEPLDPYTLIFENKIDILRPNLKEVMNMEDPYTYLGTAESLDVHGLQMAFFKSGVLQIVSARSRPEAFMSPSTTNNPDDTAAGLVDIKVTKVGCLWRKDTKKKKTRSPWQEWGAILTGSQLYFFKNAAWVKNLVHQYEVHNKAGNTTVPVVYKPPLLEFKPDAFMSVEDAVALSDSSYRKHKNAFIFIRHGGFEETFLADNENEMNDWMAKLNYASAFRTAGVRMRSMLTGGWDTHKRGYSRYETDHAASRSVETNSGDVTIQNGARIDAKLAQEILIARRQIMQQRISDAEDRLTVSIKQLDGQLRNARHLQILAPIHPRTREQVIMAAGRMAAKLKWVRMEIWRMKCHRDILAMDLEDEKKHATAGAAQPPSVPPSEVAQTNGVGKAGSLSRLSSKASTATQKPGQSPITSVRPSTRDSRVTDSGEEVFKTPPQIRSPTPTPSDLPPLAITPGSSIRDSAASAVSATSRPTSLAHRPSVASVQDNIGSPVISDAASRLASPTPGTEMKEQELLKEAGLLVEDTKTIVADSNRPSTPTDSERERTAGSVTGTPEAPRSDRSKVRRSLHRTLREAKEHTSLHGHQRSKKGKDSNSSVAATEDGATQDGEHPLGLLRSQGSFTVHGKKASVITFGSEWQKMSAEERLKLRKQAAQSSDGIKTATSHGSGTESRPDFSSSVDRRPSMVSQSSAITESTATETDAGTVDDGVDAEADTARRARAALESSSHTAVNVDPSDVHEPKLDTFMGVEAPKTAGLEKTFTASTGNEEDKEKQNDMTMRHLSSPPPQAVEA